MRLRKHEFKINTEIKFHHKIASQTVYSKFRYYKTQINLKQLLIRHPADFLMILNIIKQFDNCWNLVIYNQLRQYIFNKLLQIFFGKTKFKESFCSSAYTWDLLDIICLQKNLLISVFFSHLNPLQCAPYLGAIIFNFNNGT